AASGDQRVPNPQDGQIWSRALWDIHTALGRTTADTIVLTAQYHFNPSTTFRDAPLEVVDAGRSGGGTSAANVARRAFAARGILQTRSTTAWIAAARPATPRATARNR